MNSSALASYFNNTDATLKPAYDRLFLPRQPKIPLSFVFIYGIIAVLVVVFNGIAVIVFARRREVRKRKSNLFLLSLSAADLFVGVSSLIFLVFLLSESVSLLAKRLSTIVLGFSLETSMFSLCCITYERLVGVKNSLKYEKLVTSFTVNTAILGSWALSLVMTCCQATVALKFDEGRYFELNGVIIVVIATTMSIFLAVVYIHLYREIRRHSRNIRNTSVSATCSMDFDATRSCADTLDLDIKSVNKSRSHLDVTQEPMITVNKTSEKRRLLSSLSKEKRSSILCSFIVISFIICWAPVTIFFVGVMLKREYITRDFMLYISNCMILVNSLLDPCIYFALRNDLRRAMFSVLCRSSPGQPR
eukprot:gene13834-15280_t